MVTADPLLVKQARNIPHRPQPRWALVQRERCCWVLREVLGVERVVACLEVLGVNSDRDVGY